MNIVEAYEKAASAVILEAVKILNEDTQENLAPVLGLSQQQISHLKTGKRKLTADKAVDIVKKYNKM